MKRNHVATALIAGLVGGGGLAGLADHASAVNLNPNGLGQVLIYPYYTVNAGQQTLLTVLNTTNVGKVVKVRFLEGYNGREVLDFNLYLSLYDAWTANIFALSDAGLGSDLAGIFTTDTSCTDPVLTTSGSLNLGTGPARGYQRFRNDKYTSSAADTGPATDARTREGHVEMILMSDVLPGSELNADITHVNGVPARCATNLAAAPGYAAPIINGTTLADGGLFGSASIVDVEQGTFYAYNADALDGFSYVSLFTPPGDPQPTLASANDRGSAQTATSRVFANGESLTSIFPGPTPDSRPIDAVSSLFAADDVYNEYVVSQNGAIGTDWVLTFPTKRFYVDAQPGGAIAGATSVFAPFEQRFGANNPGQSCITIGTSTGVLDREENISAYPEPCGFSQCPPPPPDQLFCLETNVFRFATTSVLGSELSGPIFPSFMAQGMVRLDLSGFGHDLHPATNGNVFHGLPVTGFAATRFVNNFIPLPGGSFALSNYTAAYHHRPTTSCTNGDVPCL